MKDTYANEYGYPDWNWQPSECYTSGGRRGQPAGSGFTDTVLTPGATDYRAPHIEELRHRIDFLRLSLGLAVFRWTDATIVAGLTPVKAVHFTEARTALAEAYVAAGRSVPVYTDGVLLPGVTPVRVMHASELRAAVLSLEVITNGSGRPR